MKRTLKCLLVLCLALLTLSMTALAGSSLNINEGDGSTLKTIGTKETSKDSPPGGVDKIDNESKLTININNKNNLNSDNVEKSTPEKDPLNDNEEKQPPNEGQPSSAIVFVPSAGHSSNDPTTINVGYRCGWPDDSEDAPGTVWDTNHELGSTVTVRENMFTPPEGKEFLGWKSETLIIYQPGDTFTAPFQTVILTAQWGDIQEPPDEEDEEKEPDGVLTRQDIWEELSQMAGEDSNYARNWVMDIGISDGSAPDAPVSRQQLTVMLYRYATEVGGLSTDTPQDRLTAFVDGDKTDDYAAPALNWAVNEGILKGYEDQTLRVEASATSTQLGIILPRFTSTLASAS